MEDRMTPRIQYLVLVATSAFLASSLPPQAFAALAQVDTQSACRTLPPATSPDFETRLENFMAAFCYRSEGWIHDPNVRTSDGVHPFVKVYYSPTMWRWMTVSRRQGSPPDGAMLVKEQYPGLTKPLDEWTVLVKDAKGSHDGWYWADLSSPTSSSQSKASAAAQTVGDQEADAMLKCPEAAYPSIGFGEYCINCHASAVNGQSTYATTRHVLGPGEPPPSSPPPNDNIHHRLARDLFTRDIVGPSPCMVPESLDHVVAKAPADAPRHFVTSDQCTGCHNATGTLSPTMVDLPRMLFPTALANPIVNLSPNGEWRFSMMGLAGRDPIFFSQLNSENALHPKLEEHEKDAKPFVQDLCLSCHGVMGERQFKSDTGGLFTRAHLLDARSVYGGLARDGISCAVCHHIAAEGLGKPETFTAKFQLGPVNEIYGPFHENVQKLSMKNALGLTPMATEKNQIESSKLCGSCHTIVLPVYESSGRRAMRDGKPAEFYEQTTYLEWLNSSFTDRSCQSCHMPTEYKGNPLSYKIANIEDNTFPPVDFRSPDKDLVLTKRDPYHRHTLLGINLFALEMFKQFRTELGLYKLDPMLRSPDITTPGIDTAIASSLDSATQKTVEVRIQSFERNNNRLIADVQVTNLAGHSFPSGVGFRRAFVDFQVLDAKNHVIWESGKTNEDGVILDGSGDPLETEFFTPTQQRFQKHRWSKNPIRRQDQVQIYEELVRNPEGFLTTSFIALDHKVKDDRLQPKGWSSSGPYATETGPVGTCVKRRGEQVCDPAYEDGSGTSVVRYEIPIDRRMALAAYVRATLYYQSIPPYFLRQRATDAKGTDTNRLIRFTHGLKTDDTPIENWKLQIATAERALDSGSQVAAVGRSDAMK
jgi:hypothetical protein